MNVSLNKFSYNVIIANLHEIYGFFNKLEGGHNLIQNYIKILKVMIPIVPHLAYECLNDFVQPQNLSWPEVENKYLQVEKKFIVVQINGKKRGLILFPDDDYEKN